MFSCVVTDNLVTATDSHSSDNELKNNSVSLKHLFHSLTYFSTLYLSPEAYDLQA